MTSGPGAKRMVTPSVFAIRNRIACGERVSQWGTLDSGNGTLRA